MVAIIHVKKLPSVHGQYNKKCSQAGSVSGFLGTKYEKTAQSPRTIPAPQSGTIGQASGLVECSQCLCDDAASSLIICHRAHDQARAQA